MVFSAELPVHRAVVPSQREGGGALPGPVVLRRLAAATADLARSALDDVAVAGGQTDERLPLALDVSGYCLHRTEILARHARLADPRTRPSVSTDLEPARLLHTLVEQSGWRGPTVLACSDGVDDDTLRTWAQGLLSSGAATSALLGRVTVDEEDTFTIDVGALTTRER